MKLRVYERIISQLYSFKGRRLVVIRLGQIAFVPVSYLGNLRP